MEPKITFPVTVSPRVHTNTQTSSERTHRREYKDTRKIKKKNKIKGKKDGGHRRRKKGQRPNKVRVSTTVHLGVTTRAHQSYKSSPWGVTLMWGRGEQSTQITREGRKKMR